MSDNKYKEKLSVSRREAADRVMAFGRSLADGRPAQLTVNGETVALEMADPVRLELEVKVDDQGGEVEVELKWSSLSGVGVGLSKAESGDVDTSQEAATGAEMGPVDYLVVEFPAGQSNFNGEMAAELAALADAGIIRLLDLLILQKDADGSVEALEVDDLEGVDELRKLETEIAEILAAEDVAHLAEAMEPGSVAGVVVWENSWAAPFASAARRAGGQLIASGRIPIQAIAASIEAELSEGD
jgi:amphi-Trp domain-containing protein